MNPTRRSLLQHTASAALLALPAPVLALPAASTRFPRDHGAHPDYQIEWWYITGQLQGAAGRTFGFQITFFRSRLADTQAMTSRFAAKQLIFAHAAITDVQGKKMHHDQRVARSGFGLAQASELTTDVKLQGWTLARTDTRYATQIKAADFSLALTLEETQPLLLQGKQGLSRKGPQPEQASYYYSIPQLAAKGQLTLQNQAFDVTGKAWLDHEWSQALLHPDAVGWDWIGMNLDDGSALTAFRLRRDNSGAMGSTLWDGGSFRLPKNIGGGELYIFSRGEVDFKPLRSYQSPGTGTRYPVEWLVRTAVDFYTVKAVVDHQELDSRQSTGAVYWEGLSELFDSNGRKVGSGYLEMTGYAKPLSL
ncbi:MAG: lipocalin-like domain-containing protein [Burkholderiaceae bacterium]